MPIAPAGQVALSFSQLNVGSIAVGYAPYWGMYFEAEEPNCIISMQQAGSPLQIYLESSLDGGKTWSAFDYAGSTPVTLANVGDRVYFRAGAQGNARLASSTMDQNVFTTSKKCKCGGNVMSLLDGTTSMATAPGTAFSGLFSWSKITSAPQLPATTANPYCYAEMFRGCEYLVEMPQLPATSVGQEAYSGMFYNCKALQWAYPLPAENGDVMSYSGMFAGCTSLVKAPNMALKFVTADQLNHMFSGCSSLNSITVNFTNWLAGATQPTTNWVEDVADSGVFTCPSSLGTQYSIERGPSRCPQNWKVVNPDWWLHFEAEEAGCVISMATNGTPPAVTLESSRDGKTWTSFDPNGGTPVTLDRVGDKVYFRAGSAGNIRMSSNTTDYRKFTISKRARAIGNVMSLLNAADPDNVTLHPDATSAFNFLFAGNSYLESVPDFPATNVVPYAYYFMLSGCSSLPDNDTLNLQNVESYGAEIGQIFGYSSTKQVVFGTKLKSVSQLSALSGTSIALTMNVKLNFTDEDDVPFSADTMIRAGSSKATFTYNFWTDNTTIKNSVQSKAGQYTMVNVYHLDGTIWN